MRAHRRVEDLYAEYRKWLPVWQDIAWFIDPLRGQFIDRGQQPNTGLRQDQYMLNGEPAMASTILASGMHSGLTSPARPWFRYTIDDEELADYTPASTWLNKLQKLSLAISAKSDAYRLFHNIYEELADFGTGCGIVLEDYQNVIRGQHFTTGEYALGTGHDGRVNAFTRKYWATVYQVVADFGYWNCPKTVQDAYDNGRYDQWMKVVNLIQPNEIRDVHSPLAMHKAYQSLYWAEGMADNEFLRISGFELFPVLAPRWRVVGSDIYGKGPGWRALSDSKMLQKIEEDSLVGLDKQIDPPMQGPSQLLKRGGVNIRPGAMNYHDDASQNGGIRPVYLTNLDLGAVEAKIDRVERKINKYFYTDLFLMLSYASDKTMTAREVAEKHEEKLLMLGPVLENVYNDMLNPYHDRLLDICMRADLLPPPPKELQGREIRVEYISTLAQAQKMAVITAMEQSLGFAGSLGAVKPEVYDNINADKSFRIYADVTGMPPETLNTDEQMAAIRKQRAADMAQAQANENAMAAVQGAKTLSEVDTGRQNALTQILGGPDALISGGGL